MERFDRRFWNPKLCKTPEELNAALDSFGVIGKEIVGIHVIGAAKNMVPEEHRRIMRRTLAHVGVPYEEIDNGKYPTDTALVPHEVKICEPVVILFADGTTFELMPERSEGLRMSVNRISPLVLNGTNNHNFDSDTFFSCLHGRKIESIRILRQTTTSMSRSSTCPEFREIVSFQFFLDGDSVSDSIGFLLRQGWEDWFCFCVTIQNVWRGLENEIATVPYSAVKSAAYDLHQVRIVEGHDGSSYFSITPVKLSKEEPYELDAYIQERISIEEDDVSTFLSYFLFKYFDDTFPYEKYLGEYRKNQFEWYSEPNLYTYETMKEMLEDIEKCCTLLEQHFDDPSLAELKKHFRWFDFVFDDDKWNKKPTKQEAEIIVQDNIGLATDFYRRFVRRIRMMMEQAPDYEWISFTGP